MTTTKDIADKVETEVVVEVQVEVEVKVKGVGQGEGEGEADCLTCFTPLLLPNWARTKVFRPDACVSSIRSVPESCVRVLSESCVSGLGYTLA